MPIAVPLSGGGKRRVDRGRAQGAANGARRPAHSVQNRGAGVFHQVPAVGNLSCIGQRASHSLAISATTITQYDADPRVLAQPRLGGCLFAIGQQHHNAPTLQVTDDGAVAVVTTQCGGVDAITASVLVRGIARRRTRRSSVSLLTGSFSRWANLAPGLHSLLPFQQLRRRSLPQLRPLLGQDGEQCLLGARCVGLARRLPSH